jgi:hypothetical membrane protein
MRFRALLGFGMIMPVVYLLTLLAAHILNPGISLISQAASELGRASAVCPLVYNVGMIATGMAGLLAATIAYICWRAAFSRQLDPHIAARRGGKAAIACQ